MNIVCVICSDGLTSSSDIYATPCGHLFHYACLIQWIERSKTCPQCRVRTTDKTIHRIYVNLANTDHIVDDVGTLQGKIDSFQLQLRMKDKETESLKEKYKNLKTTNLALRREVASAEEKLQTQESVIRAMKDQVTYYKGRCKERTDLQEEVTKLKSKLKEVENVEKAINGTRDEVNDMIRNESSPDQLAILAAMLKKTLCDMEKKKNMAEFQIKQLKQELVKCKKEQTRKECTYEDLKLELETVKENWRSQKDFLTSLVKDMHKTAEKGHTPIVTRVMNESPLPVFLKKAVNFGDDNEGATGTSLKPDKTSKPAPYKDYTATTPRDINRFANFLKKKVERDEMGFDGLGGLTKDEVFPTGKYVTAPKRKIPTGSVSAAKFKKLGS